MPESRDRLVRPVDIAAEFARRRSGILGVLSDEGSGSAVLFGPPTQHRAPGFAVGQGTAWARGGLGRAVSGTPRTTGIRGRALYGTPMTGRENTPMTGGVGRGRGRGRPTYIALPSWYPRTPLREITPVVRALERRRARLGESVGQETESPLQLGQGNSLVTPSAAVQKKPCPHSVGKIPKILLEITNNPTAEDSFEFLTPQKKLLNQIETVEREVMDELKKLKRTPSARKAEREKKVRTLLSMR